MVARALLGRPELPDAQEGSRPFASKPAIVGRTREAGRSPAQEADRKAAAFRARWQWMPYRMPDPADPARVWRSIDLGGLAEPLHDRHP